MIMRQLCGRYGGTSAFIRFLTQSRRVQKFIKSFTKKKITFSNHSHNKFAPMNAAASLKSIDNFVTLIFHWNAFNAYMPAPFRLMKTVHIFISSSSRLLSRQNKLLILWGTPSRFEYKLREKTDQSYCFSAKNNFQMELSLAVMLSFN